MADARRPELNDLYELLEVSPRASADVIQAAYRVLVRVQHPDLNATAEAAQRTRELNAAYHILSDPERRARYDLELTRARRLERMSQPMPRRATHTVLPLREARADRTVVHERASMFSGQAIIAMLLVAIVFTIVLVLVWVSLDGSDAAVEVNPTLYSGHRVELSAP
jgi:hypothetical protein